MADVTDLRDYREQLVELRNNPPATKSIDAGVAIGRMQRTIDYALEFLDDAIKAEAKEPTHD